MGDLAYAMQWRKSVRREGRLTPAQRFVALAMGDEARPDGSGFYVGQLAMSKTLGVSRDLVADTYRDLDQLGWIEFIRMRGRAKEYRLAIVSSVAETRTNPSDPSVAETRTNSAGSGLRDSAGSGLRDSAGSGSTIEGPRGPRVETEVPTEVSPRTPTKPKAQGWPGLPSGPSPVRHEPGEPQDVPEYLRGYVPATEE